MTLSCHTCSALVWAALSFAIGGMCNRIIIRLVAFGGLAAFSHSVSAADLTGQVTLAQALALTLKQNPDLTAFSWGVRSAEARVLQARLRPNPELGMQSEDIGGSKQSTGFSHSQTTLQLSQLVELGGKRSARVHEATFGRELAKLDYESKRLDILKKTAQAFVEVLSAQERVRLAQVVPNVILSAGPRYISETGEWTQVIGFSLPLPFWNRNQGAILEARHQLAKADDEKRSAVTRLSSELNDAYQTVARTSNEIHVLKESVLPGAEKAVESIRQGYEAGRFSYLDVNEARRTLTAARLQYLQALSDYHKAVAEIEALTVQPFDAKIGFSK